MPSRFEYFDCFATYGPYPQKHPFARWRLEELVEDMDLAGVSGALVQYTQQTLGDPMRANHAMAEAIQGMRGRLFPCWIALPDTCGDFPKPETFLREMKAHDVRAVRIESAFLELPPKESVWGELRDALVAEKIPVLFAVGRSTSDFGPVEALMRIFQGTEMILAGHNWNRWRWMEYLLRSYPSLHMEFSNFQANRAVEYFSAKYGAERFLFGSGLMGKAPGASRGFFDWSLCAAEDVRKMTGGNLSRLLKDARPASGPAPTEWTDALTAAEDEGKPLPCTVLDNHCHILHDGGVAAGRGVICHKGDAEGMVELKRRIGIDRTAIMSWEAPVSYDVDLGNDTVARAVERYPEEFIGVAGIDPLHQTPEEIQATIREYHERRRFPGLKFLIAGAGVNYDDPLLADWYAYGNERHLWAVIDPCGRQDSEMIGNLVSRYPNLRISLDHCGQNWPYAIWAAQMVNAYPTVDAQLTFTNVTNGVIEYLVKACGADRVLFGTDTPMRDPRPQVSWLVFTRLREEEKRTVFGENFQKIIDAVRW